jgi:photosystem II stability/assembly factor-like uncharacterized protein
MGRGRVCLAVLILAAAGMAQAQTPASAPKYKGIWEPVNYSEDLYLTDVFFVTPDIGYVAGNSGTILKTSDAGGTWTALLGGDPASQERAISHLWFVTPEIGWAAQITGTHTNLLRTTDGDTWTRIGMIPEHFEDFAFASESLGIYVNDEQIFQTRDAGKTWRNVGACATKAVIGGLTREANCDLWKLRFATPDVVYALGQGKRGADAAFVMRSDDGGDSWAVISVIEGENGSEGGLFFLDENVGYFSTKYGKSAYRTVDGGKTWNAMPATSVFRQIVFADPEVGWSMMYKQLVYTTDGGKRWFSRDLPFPAMPNAFSLPRRDRAYVVGDHGMIFRYSVVPASAPVAAATVISPAMPALDNGVLGQLAQLDTRVDTLSKQLESGAGGGAGADWTDTPAGQELLQLQGTVDAVATGVPGMGRKHRSLNLLNYGLTLLGDLTGQGSELKQAFAGLRGARDLQSVSTALTSLNGQIDAMKTSVATFQSAKRTGG